MSDGSPYPPESVNPVTRSVAPFITSKRRVVPPPESVGRALAEAARRRLDDDAPPHAAHEVSVKSTAAPTLMASVCVNGPAPASTTVVVLAPFAAATVMARESPSRLVSVSAYSPLAGTEPRDGMGEGACEGAGVGGTDGVGVGSVETDGKPVGRADGDGVGSADGKGIDGESSHGA